MDRTKRVTRRRELRKTQKTIHRRELFVSDYIHIKYNDIYAEAVKFYDALDGQYPIKNDLKKTDEYRLWKINVKKASSSLNARTQAPRQIYSDNFELKIPLMVHPSVTPETTESVTATQTLETATATETLETVTAAETMETATATETLETVTAAETMETVTAAETLETFPVDATDPSLNLEISLEDMQEILEELRKDPYLSSIFSNVEEQFDFMDIEIPEYGQDLLEKELENW